MSAPVAAIVLGVLLLLGIVPAAHLAAARLPIPVTDPTPVVDRDPAPELTALRALPVGLPGSTSGIDFGYPYRYPMLDAENRAADAACPGDPTPLWILGQTHSG